MSASKLSRLLCVAAMLLAIAGCASAAELEIKLPAVIEARAGSFHLGEYAEIEGDLALSDAASMVLLDPRGGKLTREEVIAALSTSDVAGHDVALRVPQSIRVLPEGRVASELRAMTGWKWRIAVAGDEAIDDWTDFTLPPRVSPGATAVTAKIDPGTGRRGSKQIKLAWFQPVVCSTKPLSRGEQIDFSGLTTRIETIRMNDNCVWDRSMMRGSSPRQAIAAQRPITDSDLEHVNVIKNGSTITLVSRENGLGIEMAGVAMQRGGIGDVIKVRNLSSKKILQGTVIDVGRVLID